MKKELSTECIKPKNGYYIDNDKFLELIKKYKESKPKAISEELGEMFLLLVENISFSKSFINYSEDWKNEMKSDALYNCCKYIDKFDTDKYSNPYGYFTMIAFNAFKMRIKKEKTVMLKDNKLRGEIFQEFLSEEGLYKHKGFDMEDEDNQVFAEMDNMKIDIEEIIKENNLLKEETKVECIEPHLIPN